MRLECNLHTNSENNPNCVIINHEIYGNMFCLNNFDNDFRIDELIKMRNFLNKIIDKGVSDSSWVQNNKDLIDFAE